MADFDYDLFVIGAGSGGVRAARMAANRGARVGVAESRYLGGTCVNVGCVPKKLFVYASHYGEDFHEAQGYGWSSGAPEFSWQRLRDNKNAEIERLNGIYEGLLNNAGVTIHHGHASFVDPHSLQVDGKIVTARHVLIATGSWPFIPDFPGREHVLSSNEMFYLDELPKRAAIVGGGYIAVEFAGILNGLGVDTTVIYRGPLFLRGFDDEVREFAARELSKKGICLKFETDVSQVDKQEDGSLRLQLAQGTAHESGADSLDVDLVMYATGRRPLVEGLGLEAVGVALNDGGAIAVDQYLRTSVDHIYALGDVIDRYPLTPVAIAEGMAVVQTLFGDSPTEVDYEAIPTAVFCQPEIGTVGPTEAQAREAYGAIRVYQTEFRPMKHTMTGSDERTLMKLLVRDDTDQVVAAHMAGPDAGEIIQSLAIAIKAGATKAQFDATMAVHPTASEEFVTMGEVTRR